MENLQKRKIPWIILGHVALKYFQVERSMIHAQQFGDINFQEHPVQLSYRKLLILASHNIDTFNILSIYIFHV